MVNDVTRARLRRLAGQHDGCVLSVFLDLDPSTHPHPPARQSALDSLLSDARRRVEERDLDHAEQARLRKALAELEATLQPVTGAADGARAIAAFAPGPDGGVEMLRLPAPVDSRVVLDVSPHVEPLVGLADGERLCVALVNRSAARFMLGDESDLRVTGEFDDDVQGQHRGAGLAERRHQNSIEEEVLHHLDRTARALGTALMERDLFDVLVCAGPQEMRNLFEDRLHPQVRERLCGWIDVDVAVSTPDEVRAAATTLLDARRAGRQNEVLDKLQAGLAGGNGAVAAGGLHDVLRVLNERRVASLIVAPGTRAPGARCPACGLLATSGTETCPADGTALAEVGDVVDAAVAAALEQDAEVLTGIDDARIARNGGIAAVLRF